MFASDGEQIAIARVDYDLKLVVGEFEPGGERIGTAVRGVKPIQAHVPGDATSAAYARDNRDLIEVCLRVQDTRAKQFTVVPMPHPAHQMCGIRSIRRNGSTGF